MKNSMWPDNKIIENELIYKIPILKNFASVLIELIIQYVELKFMTTDECRLFDKNFYLPRSRTISNSYRCHQNIKAMSLPITCVKNQNQDQKIAIETIAKKFPENINHIYYISTPWPFYQDGKWFILGTLNVGINYQKYFLWIASIDDDSVDISDGKDSICRYIENVTYIDLDYKFYIANTFDDIYACGLTINQRKCFDNYQLHNIHKDNIDENENKKINMKINADLNGYINNEFDYDQYITDKICRFASYGCYCIIS